MRTTAVNPGIGSEIHLTKRIDNSEARTDKVMSWKRISLVPARLPSVLLIEQFYLRSV